MNIFFKEKKRVLDGSFQTFTLRALRSERRLRPSLKNERFLMPARGQRSHPIEGVKAAKKRLPKLPRSPEAADLAERARFT